MGRICSMDDRSVLFFEGSGELVFSEEYGKGKDTSNSLSSVDSDFCS